MSDDEKPCVCGHGKKFHAIPSEHNLGTSHCTDLRCFCTEFREMPPQEEQPKKKVGKTA